jgi:transaldolase
MSPNPNLQRLHEAGVSIWLDTLSRQLLESGGFAELIHDYSVTGATSNPTIFAKAIAGSDLYDQQLRRLAATGHNDTQELFFATALDDVREAAEHLRPEYDRPGGMDGFISFECTPDLADDTDATIAQAIDLWQRIDRPNAMIKVPGTEAGMPAIEELTRRGVNVNITLLFSIERYEQVIDAYLRGLAARARAGEPLDSISSVASFFLSRIDTKVDPELPGDSPLRGRVASERADLLPALPGQVRRPGMGATRARGRSTSTPALGQHGNEEPPVLRRALRLGADRAGRRKHDARADAASVRRPR